MIIVQITPQEPLFKYLHIRRKNSHSICQDILGEGNGALEVGIYPVTKPI